MICDRAKLTVLRTKTALTQEALAGKSKLDVRTIQRAEAGKPLGLQTIQEIASALGVSPLEIMAEDHPEGEETYDGETTLVALKPQASARRLLDVLADCLDCKLSCSVDLTTPMAEVVKLFCEAIRPVLPELCPSEPYSAMADRGRDEATRLMDRIKVEAVLNDGFAALQRVGLHIYAGTFVDYQQIPRWDPDEGCYCTRINQRQEAVKIALVRIAEADKRQVPLRVKCNALPF